MADGKVVIDVILDDGQVVKGVANIGKQLGGVQGSGQKAAFGIGKLVAALGLVALASKGIDMVKNALDGAISRYDTLNNFPRVLQLMGFDAKESQAAIDKLADGIDGLPTTLDSVAKNAQRIALMTGDLDGAVDTTLALNNAFLASGASTVDAERGLEQYVQMLSKGEVDLQSWRTLQETMPIALNKTAEAFGFTGKSAQRDLYEALKHGEITFDQFNDKLIELSNKTGGFADIASEASGGIKTAWTNMNTAIVKGVADVIGAIDKALGGTGSIEAIINKMKDSIKGFFAFVAENIPGVIEKIIAVKDALEPWLPLLSSIAAGFVAFAAINSVVSGVSAAIAVFDGLKKALTGAKLATDAAAASQKAYNLVLSLNPWVLLAAAIIAAAVLVYVYWEPIKEFFINLWEGIKKAGLAIWDSLKGAWETAVESIKSAWSAVTDFFSKLWDAVKRIFSTIWNGIVSVVMAIIQPFINGITNIFNNMKDGLTKTLDGLKQYFSGVWDLIKNIFLGAVLLILNLVTGNFEELRSNAKAIFENIKGALKNIWEGIKTVFSGALSAIWGFVKGVWGNIKSNTNTVFNTTKSLITNIWNGIKTFFSDTLKNIWNTVKQKFSDIVNSIRDKMNEVKGKVEDGWNKAKSYLEGIDLKQIGKDVIQGLINGIKSKISDVANAAKEAADAVTGKIKSILKIASPSKVLTQIGEWVSEGLAKGIKKKKKEVDAIAEKMAKAITQSANAMNKEIKAITTKAKAEIKQIESKSSAEIKQIAKRSQEDINLIHAKAKKAKRKLTQAEVVRIRRIQEDAAKKIKNIESKSASDIKKINSKSASDVRKIRENHSKKVEEINKKEFENSKNWIDNKKKYNELSLADELAAWERVQKRYKAGSKEREEAEENIYRVKKEIHDKLNSLNDEYLKKIEDVNKKLIEEENKLNEEYRKALDDRTKSLYSFAGIFDEIKEKSDVSGQQLIDNLKGQVNTFAEWAANIRTLAERGIDEGLLAELRDMGPKAAAEIAALNSLSDDQLTEYAGLWKTKNQLARQQATEELEGMKQDTAKKIEELHLQSRQQLDQLKKEWTSKVKEIRYGTKNEFNPMKSDLRTIGEQSIQGMISGLESMEGALMAKARSIADSVKKTMAKAFDIHSPSRWMRDMIGRNMLLGWQLGIDREKAATLKKAAQMTDWMKPDVPNGFVNRLRGVTVPVGHVTPISAASSGSSSITNNSNKSYNPTIQNYFTRDESTPSEVARKNKQQQQRLAMEWGYS